MTVSFPESDCLSVQKRGSVLSVVMNRPEKHNALNIELIAALTAMLKKAETADDIRVLILSGSGDAFCAGADFEILAGSFDNQTEALSAASALLRKLRDFPKPVIAAVNGVACAGGLEIVLASDIAIAASSAKFGDAHANYGAFPGGGGACVLPRRVGMVRAKYLLFSGSLIDADTALHWGLISDVVANSGLQESAMTLATEIADKSPLAISAMKKIANSTESSDVETGFDDEQTELRRQIRTRDFAEGMKAFREKRKPEFVGT